MTAPTGLRAHAIPGLPDTLSYIPNFITPAEEQQLLASIHAQPKPKWTQLTHRRLQAHPSALSATNTLLAAPLAPWLTSIVPRMHALDIWADAPHGGPNHVLINEYRPGEGIMAHEDGPAYHPVVATVSLGAAIVLDIFEKREGGAPEKRWRVLQEPRSLLVTTGEMYTNYMHGIDSVEADEDLGPETVANWELLADREAFAAGRYERQTRTSLTYRDVLKVSKLGSKLFSARK